MKNLKSLVVLGTCDDTHVDPDDYTWQRELLPWITKDLLDNLYEEGAQMFVRDLNDQSGSSHLEHLAEFDFRQLGELTDEFLPNLKYIHGGPSPSYLDDDQVRYYINEKEAIIDVNSFFLSTGT